MPVRHGVVAIVPAKDEAERISSTVRAVAALPHTMTVIVVDDGSADDTAALAADAGRALSQVGETLAIVRDGEAKKGEHPWHPRPCACRHVRRERPHERRHPH